VSDNWLVDAYGALERSTKTRIFSEAHHNPHLYDGTDIRSPRDKRRTIGMASFTPPDQTRVWSP